MPLPTPTADETRDDFVDRCMADESATEDHPDEDERREACAVRFDESAEEEPPAEEPEEEPAEEGDDMALPAPDADETREEFIDRCSSSEEAVAEFPDEEDRRAACAAAWDDAAPEEEPPAEEDEEMSAHACPKCQKGLRKPALPARPTWHSLKTPAGRPEVDREKGIIRNVILAEEGRFKSRRGEFDKAAIREVVRLAKAAPGGLKSRLGHPTLSDDGVAKFAGRIRNVRNASVEREGRMVSAARGDIHFDRSAHKTPGGDLANYLMDRAESDPDSLNMSLVLQADEELRLDAKGRPLSGEDGEPLPPLWRPKALHAVDVVDTGDATNAFLSAAALPDSVVRQGTALLDSQFAGATPDVIWARATAWLNRYLSWKFGDKWRKPAKAAPRRKASKAVADEVLLADIDLRLRESI